MRRGDEQMKAEQSARLAALEGRQRACARRVAIATTGEAPKKRARDKPSRPRDGTPPQDTGPSQPMGLGLALGIAALPVVFSWFTLRRGFTSLVRLIAFLWLVTFLGIGAWPG